jgi:1-acyl-sn-glycerol-3-phosphate acyltransferase
MKRQAAPRPSPLIVPLMRRVVLPFLLRRYRVTAQGDLGAVRSLAPPYLVVANHVNYWDPFWISAFLRHPVQFVTSDNVFREALFSLAMRLVGSIPKTKLMNDSRTVRQILGVRGNRGVIGIFPEGSRSDDGKTGLVIPAVARLIRKLGIPVVSARIAGGYLSRPRWARFVRRGRVEIGYRLLFSREQLSRATDEHVSTALTEGLEHDEMAWQRTKSIRFRGPRPAEYLERLLFICPHCRAVSALESDDDLLSCRACGSSVRVTPLGFFEARQGPLYFDDPATWNSWQLPVFAGILAERTAQAEPIFVEMPVTLLKGYRERPLRRVGKGSAVLRKELIEFRGTSAVFRFLLPKIQGVNVQNGEKLEFYHEGVLHRLDFADPRASSYKWTRAIEILATDAGQASSLIRANTY